MLLFIPSRLALSISTSCSFSAPIARRVRYASFLTVSLSLQISLAFNRYIMCISTKSKWILSKRYAGSWAAYIVLIRPYFEASHGRRPLLYHSSLFSMQRHGDYPNSASRVVLRISLPLFSGRCHHKTLQNQVNFEPSRGVVVVTHPFASQMYCQSLSLQSSSWSFLTIWLDLSVGNGIIQRDQVLVGSLFLLNYSCASIRVSKLGYLECCIDELSDRYPTYVRFRLSNQHPFPDPTTIPNFRITHIEISREEQTGLDAKCLDALLEDFQCLECLDLRFQQLAEPNPILQTIAQQLPNTRKSRVGIYVNGSFHGPPGTQPFSQPRFTTGTRTQPGLCEQTKTRLGNYFLI